MPTASSDSRQDGFVLVLVLGVLLVLAAAIAAFTMFQTTDARARRGQQALVELTALADGMVRLDAYRLGEQRERRQIEVPTDGSPRWCWHGDAQVARWVQDVAGLVNLNTAGAEVFETLLVAAGVAASEARTIAPLIVAYREPAPTSRLPIARPQAYVDAGFTHGPKHAPFQAVAELDQIPGVSRYVLERLRPYMTVHGQSAAVDLRAAPPTLRAILQGTESPARRERSRFFVVTAQAMRGGVTVTREAVVEFAQRATTGFVVHEWSLVSTPPLGEAPPGRSAPCFDP